MATAAFAATLVVVFLHGVFMLAETVGWNQMGRRFGYTPKEVETTRTLALNQGFYNGGVAAVLAWAAFADRPDTVVGLLFFVIAMSIVGALSARWTILLIQGAPAAVAAALVLM